MIQQILSCDWGTSSFRLRLINVAHNAILAETTDSKGIAAVYNEWLQRGYPENNRVDFYKGILVSKIKSLADYSLEGVPIIISGMASSSIGITELAYGGVPFPISVDNLHVMKIPPDTKRTHEILLVSGLKTINDVMRGEETMLTGCEINDDNEQLIIFPGTHSKHAIVKNKTLVDFKTYMTGEMFELLADKSILSKSVVKNGSDQNNIFERGVQEGVAGNVLNTMFHVRTNHLFNTLTPEENYHYLSGLLIGCELKEAVLSNVQIHLICSEELSGRYLSALRTLCKNDSLYYTNADKALINCHCKLALHYY